MGREECEPTGAEKVMKNCSRVDMKGEARLVRKF